MIVLDYGSDRALAKDQTIVLSALWLMLVHYVGDHFSCPRVESQWQELIKEREGVLDHLLDLTVENVIEVAELVDDIERRVNLESLDDGLSRDADELSVQDLKLLPETREALEAVFAQSDVDQHLSLSHEGDFEALGVQTKGSQDGRGLDVLLLDDCQALLGGHWVLVQGGRYELRLGRCLGCFLLALFCRLLVLEHPFHLDREAGLEMASDN